MSKRTVFYYIALALLLTALLLIVANNVPVLASYRWLWAPLFLIFSLSFFKQVFTLKPVIASLLYGLLYVGILQYSIWINANDWYKTVIFEDFYAMIVFVILFSILKQQNYQREWIRLTKLGILFIVITGLMTIIATHFNPMIVRASYSSAKLEIANYSSFYRLGFGSYGYMAAVVALLPILVYFIRLNRKTWLSKRVLMLLMFFFFYILLKAQIFANILVASLIVFLSFLGKKRFYKTITYIAIVFFTLIIIPKSFYVRVLTDAGNFFDPQSVVYQKFNDMAVFVANPVIQEDNTATSTGGRASRYPALWKAFIASPLWGDANYDSIYDYEMATGGHLYWMSRLALWGILGFIGYLVILKTIFNSVIRMFDEEFRFFYFLSLLSVILLGLLKNLGGREPYIVLLIIIPGLYFLSISDQNSRTNKNNVDYKQN